VTRGRVDLLYSDRESGRTYSDKETSACEQLPRHIPRADGVLTWPETAVPGMGLGASLDGHMQRTSSMVCLGPSKASLDGPPGAPQMLEVTSASQELGLGVGGGGKGLRMTRY